MFIKYYLPFFRGDLFTEGNEVTNNLLLQEWLKLSGGPLMSVKVIDTAGSLLFTVPALATTAMLNTQRKENTTPFAEIVKMAHHYSLISPVAEQNHTNASLEQKFKDMYNKDYQIGEREKAWFDILARYEITHPRPSVAQAATNAPSVASETKPKGFDDKFSDDEMQF